MMRRPAAAVLEGLPDAADEPRRGRGPDGRAVVR